MGKNGIFRIHMQKEALHIAVAGNIGAGKTTLVTRLSQHYGWAPQYEAVDDNPYLEDFYADMSKYSFPLQIYFLNSRFEQIRAIRDAGNPVIQDRTIYEDAFIFAKNLQESGKMTMRDYENYRRLFDSMTSVVQAPDLLIYLRTSIPVLTERIARRGRDYEAGISIGYLEELHHKYEDWIESYEAGKLLIIESDQLNFADNEEDLATIVRRIDAELHGLFSDEGSIAEGENLTIDFKGASRKQKGAAG